MPCQEDEDDGLPSFAELGGQIEDAMFMREIRKQVASIKTAVSDGLAAFWWSASISRSCTGRVLASFSWHRRHRQCKAGDGGKRPAVSCFTANGKA